MWTIDTHHLDKPILFSFEDRKRRKGMLIKERDNYYLLSNDMELDGAECQNKHGYKFSYWIACDIDLTVSGLEIIRIARKMNHEQ